MTYKSEIMIYQNCYKTGRLLIRLSFYCALKDILNETWKPCKINEALKTLIYDFSKTSSRFLVNRNALAHVTQRLIRYH